VGARNGARDAGTSSRRVTGARRAPSAKTGGRRGSEEERTTPMISPSFLVRAAITFALLASTPMAEAQAVPEGGARPEGPGAVEAQAPVPTPAPAPGTRPCARRAAIIERLENRFGEVRQGLGLNRSNGVVEVFVSAETGTWTILLTNPNGMSCLIASGDLWESEAGPLVKPGKDA
jgi:hypothetical protein